MMGFNGCFLKLDLGESGVSYKGQAGLENDKPRSVEDGEA